MSLIEKIGNETIELFSKFAIYVAVVILAIMGKVGWDIINKKSISGWYILGFSMLAIFISTMVGLICSYKGLSSTATTICIGTSAIFSRDIMVILTTMKWTKIANLNWKDVILMLTTKTNGPK